MRYESSVGDCSDIHIWLLGEQPTYFYTARHFRHCIAWWHLPVASSTLVFRAVGRRASSYFLGPGRARATTAAAPMTLLLPASLPLPSQHSSCGDPAAARYSTLITSSVVMSNITYYITAVISVYSYIRQSVAWAFYDRNDGRFVKEL